MALAAETSLRAHDVRSGGPDAPEMASASTPAAVGEPVGQDKVLPLPGWLVKVYFIFPVVLYVPDAIFNYFVYSDGVSAPQGNLAIQIFTIALWGFLSVGVVGMAYLLSVLAPWHWGQGHRVQAFFCGLGVVIATAITTWNSLAFRSSDFKPFQTDMWVNQVWPQLEANHISITMILVAVAPPFWGLFWAIVQPTQTGRSLRQLRETHAERLLRLQQEAEVKALRAQTNAKIREAQLRGMAATAAAAREQAKGIFKQGKDDEEAQGRGGESLAIAGGESGETSDVPSNGAVAHDPTNVLKMPVAPAGIREPAGAHAGMSFYNHAAAATPTAHSASAGAARHAVAQASLLASADVEDSGLSDGDASSPSLRRPPVIGGDIPAALTDELSDAEAMTGTTGPRSVVRKPTELGSLTRGLNEPPARYMVAVEEAMQELGIPAGKRGLTAKETRDIVPLVADKLNVNDQMARAVIGRVLRVRDAQRVPTRG